MTFDKTTLSMEINTDREIEEAAFGRFHFRLGALISLILFFDGFELQNSAYVVHFVAIPWGLSPGGIGMMLSSGLAGFALGSAVSGLFGDRFGRRSVLLIGCWASGAMSLVIAVYAHSLYSYAALRLGMGLALGLLMPLAVTYLNEIAPARTSNLFAIVFFAIGWLGGSSSVGAIAVWLTPRYGWQSLYYVGGVALAIGAAIQLWLPESPRFLARHARWNELATLLGKLRPERVHAYRSGKFELSSAPRRGVPIRLLMQSEYRHTTLRFWAAGALSLFSAYGLSGWLPTMMLKRGETLSSSFAYGSLFASMAVVVGLMSGYAADRFGDRRRVLIASYLVGAAMVAFLAYAPTHVTRLIAVAGAGGFVGGSQLLLNNFVAVSYPTAMRSTGVGMFLAIARIGATFGPTVAGLLQQWTGGAGAMYAAIGGATLATAIVVSSVQTQGRSAVVMARIE